MWRPRSYRGDKSFAERSLGVCVHVGLLCVWPWWWLAERGAVASGAFAKPLVATPCHPVAAALWDTPQVAAAKQLIGLPCQSRRRRIFKMIQTAHCCIIAPVSN